MLPTSLSPGDLPAGPTRAAFERRRKIDDLTTQIAAAPTRAERSKLRKRRHALQAEERWLMSRNGYDAAAAASYRVQSMLPDLGAPRDA
jgi:hypothetical protein